MGGIGNWKNIKNQKWKDTEKMETIGKPLVSYRRRPCGKARCEANFDHSGTNCNLEGEEVMGSTVSRDGSTRGDRVSLQFPYQVVAASALENGDDTKNPASNDVGVDDKAPEKPETTEKLKSFSSVVDNAQSSGTSRWGWLPSILTGSELANPGSYEEIANEAQAVFRTERIDGLTFNMAIPQSSNVSTGVSTDLGGKDKPPSFAIISNYFTNNLVMMGRLTPSDWHLNGRVFLRHGVATMSKVFGEVALADPLSSRLSWEIDYRGSSYAAQAKFANGGGGLVCALSYLQAITSSLALGGEGFYQTKSQFTALNVAAKYTNDKDTATLTVATFGPICATFSRKVNAKCTLATELFVDARNRDSHVSMGYKFDLRSASVTGVVDSTGKVAAVVEERITPGFSLLLSGELDHQKEDYKFGIGINFGQ